MFFIHYNQLCSDSVEIQLPSKESYILQLNSLVYNQAQEKYKLSINQLNQ